MVHERVGKWISYRNGIIMHLGIHFFFATSNCKSHLMDNSGSRIDTFGRGPCLATSSVGFFSVVHGKIFETGKHFMQWHARNCYSQKLQYLRTIERERARDYCFLSVFLLEESVEDDPGSPPSSGGSSNPA